MKKLFNQLSSILMLILGKILGYQIKKALNEDKELQKLIKDADADLEETRNQVDSMIKQGITPPEFMRKYATPELSAMIGKWKDYEKNPAKYNYILDK